MIRCLSFLLLLAGSLGLSAPAPASADPVVPGDEHCVVNVRAGDVLNLRAWPSPRSRVTYRIPRTARGVAFPPYARDGWQKIRVAGREGWANRRHLGGQ